MRTKTVLIISDQPADFHTVSAALDRAKPQRFRTITSNVHQQQVEALLNPVNDAIILGYTPETAYLLRLTQKRKPSPPVILLFDPEFEADFKKMKVAGASDYIVRGFLSDDLLHRTLDTNINLYEVQQRHQHDLQRQRVESFAQQGGERLRSVSGSATHSTMFNEVRQPSPAAFVLLDDPAESDVPTITTTTASAAEQAAPVASNTIWKAGIAVLLIAAVLLGVRLVDQRLFYQSQLARLEASNAIFVQQVNQMHSDLTRIALARITQSPVVEIAASPVTAPAAESTVEEVSVAAATPAIPAIRIVSAAQTWFVNLGTFSSLSAAQRFADSLQPTAQQIEIQAVAAGERQLFRVRLLNVPNEAAADSLAREYQSQLGGNPLWVGRMN